MHTTATLHVHPAAANPFQIFEARRLARAAGCAFVPSKPRIATAIPMTASTPPSGGNAA